MSSSSNMKIASGLLSDLNGRDKIIRTCSFAAGFLATFAVEGNAVKLRTIQGQLSSCRVVFRLFGDIPMWVRAKRTSWGKKELKVEPEASKNPFAETVSVLNVVADLLFSPVEHVAWAAQNKLVPISAGHWWTAAQAVWAASLVLAIIKALSNMSSIRRKMRILSSKRKLQPGSHFIELLFLSNNISRDNESDVDFCKLRSEEMCERLNVLRCLSDLLCAVNSLPRGVLWAQKLSARAHSFFGIVASLTSLYQIKSALFPGIIGNSP